MLPTMPTPTITTSTSLRRCAMRYSLKVGRDVGPHVDVAFAILGEAHGLTLELHAMLVDGFVVVRVRSGEADHAPGDHVFVAAVGRICEEAFHGHAQQQVKKR